MSIKFQKGDLVVWKRDSEDTGNFHFNSIDVVWSVSGDNICKILRQKFHRSYIVDFYYASWEYQFVKIYRKNKQIYPKI